MAKLYSVVASTDAVALTTYSMMPSSSIWLPDDFHFNSMERTEDVTRYISGGYHPILIGDRPPNEPRYRIMHKLGYGSYATVWLAQKTDSSQAFVAVKVTTAESDGNLGRECAMLEAASNVQTDHAKSHVLTLLDHFMLRGPNGTHSVLVTEVVVPILPLLFFQYTPHWRKSIAHGLAQGVAQLHSRRIVHGDLHLGNIGIAFPQLADQDALDVMQDLSSYDLTIVLPTSPTKNPSSLPPYVVAPCDIAAYYHKFVNSESSHPQTKIFDYGCAHESGTLPLSFQCAIEACAPENAFAQTIEKKKNPPVDLPADVWALGTAIYEIVTGSSLFYGLGLSALPYKMVVMAGSLPSEWQMWHSSLSNPPQVSLSGADAWWESRRKYLRQNCVGEADTDALITLLRKVLVLDPTERPTAPDVLRDPWFQ